MHAQSSRRSRMCLLYGIRMLATAVLSLVAYSVHADSPAAPYSYTVPTPDGKYVFVAIVSLESEKYLLSEDSPMATEVREIHSKYTQSGLYLNGASTSPIWTVDWYAYSVEPLSDGVHLVRHGPWATSSDSEAVAFFANGELIRSYTVGDLVAIPSLMPHSVSHFFWRLEERLDDSATTYTISTLHREQYTFDVTTGEIIDSFSPVRMSLVVALCLFFVACCYWFWRRKQAS